ncbi:MAG: low molecular weight phosphatase family protein [Alphaproteobacteria bacterium]|nr:low molecular weight phosphatase family protein [Alphaproteobacteria bacterium]
MSDLPSRVLFACTWNAVRSPMAEGLMKQLFGTALHIDSVGVRRGAELDGFVIAVLEEIGIDASRHQTKTFDDLEDNVFDLIITLSPEAQHKAVELTRVMPCEVEFWHTLDPSIIEGNREARLIAYRQVRDQLRRRLLERFSAPPRPGG